MPRWEISNFWTCKTRRVVIGERDISSIGMLRLRCRGSWQPCTLPKSKEKGRCHDRGGRTCRFGNHADVSSGPKTMAVKLMLLTLDFFLRRACSETQSTPEPLSNSSTPKQTPPEARAEQWGTLRPINFSRESFDSSFPRQVFPGCSLPAPERKATLYARFARVGRGRPPLHGENHVGWHFWQVAAAHPAISGRASLGSGIYAARNSSKFLHSSPCSWCLNDVVFKSFFWWNLGDQGAHLRLCSNWGLPQLNAGLLHGCVTWGSGSTSATCGTSRCT